MTTESQNSNTHTPGPWRRGIGNEARTVFDSQGRIVCERHGYADGTLIAAAPEMLHALKAALPVMIDDMKDGYERSDGKDAAAIKLIRTAIAKAEGSHG